MKTCTKCGAIMTAQSTNKFVCEFCGNTLIEQETPKAGSYPQQQPVREREIVYVRDESHRSEEKLGCWLWGLCCVIPIVGLILFFVYKSQDEKLKAKSAITAAIIGFIIGLLFQFGGFWDAFWEGFFGSL